MNKLNFKIVFCMLLLFSLSFASASEFDNVKKYDPIKREVTIKNSFLGFPTTQVAKIRLDTPLLNEVEPGEDKIVAEFTVWGYDDYDEFLKALDFYDRTKQNWKENKFNSFDYTLMYKTYEWVQVDDYENVCDKPYVNCEYKKVGKHKEYQPVWQPLTKNSLKKNEVLTIGIMTDVKRGDYVEWIPTMFGLEIEEFAGWSSSLQVGLIHYYAFNETIGNLLDIINTSDMNVQGPIVRGGTGIVQGEGTYYFDATTGVTYNNSVIMTKTNNFTVGAWVYSGGSQIGQFVSNGQEGGGIFSGYSFQLSDIAGSSAGSVPGVSLNGIIFQSSQVTINHNTWFHMVYVRENGIATFYINGTPVTPTNSGSTPNVPNGRTSIGARYNGGSFDRYFNGNISQVFFMDRPLSASEVSEIYNNHNGLPLVGEDEPPTIIFNSPNATNYTTSPQTFQFNFTASDDINLTSVQLYVNGALNQTNASGINNTDYLFNLTVSDGTYQVYGKAIDNESLQTNTETRTFIIDSTLPLISIFSPVSAYYFLEENQLIDLNYSINDTNIDMCWFTYGPMNVSLSNNGDTPSALLDNNYSTKVGNSNRTYYFEVNQLYLNGSFLNITVSSSSGISSTTRSSLNDCSTNLINVSQICPGDLSNTCVSYFSCGNLSIANVSSADGLIFNPSGVAEIEHYRGYFEEPLNCSLNASFKYIAGVNNLTIYANDTLGNSNSYQKNWSIQYIDLLNYTYEDPINIGTNNQITARVFINTTSNIDSVYIVHGNFTNTASIASVSGNIYELSSANLAQEIGNISFYYSILLNNGSYVNFTTQYQQVNPLLIDNCSNYSYTLFNMTLWDELSINPLNGTIEADLTITPSTSSIVVQQNSFDFTNIQNASICSSDLLNTSSNYLLSLEVRYFSSNYSSEFYHIQDMSIDDTPTNIELYDLADNQTTVFTIVYRGSSTALVDDAILLIQRKYVNEGIFRTVEAPLTSNIGEAIGHFDLDNYKYQIIATKNGEVLDIFTNPLVSCQNEFLGDCVISLRAPPSISGEQSIISTKDFSATATEDNGSVSVTYAIPSGNSQTVNVQMIQNDRFGSRQLCNTTVFSSASTITCNVNKTLGDSVIDIDIFKNAELQGSFTAFYQEDLSEYFFLNNYFIGIVLIISATAMMISSIIAMVIILVCVIFFMGFVFLLKGVSIGLISSGIGWLVVSAIILIVKLARQDENPN